MKRDIGINNSFVEDDDWDSDFDMGDIRIKKLINNNQLSDPKLKELGYDMKYREELNHFIDGYDDWIWDYHHAGFDIVSNRILEVLDEYITTYSTNFKGERCFWVTGHSMGGGVANLVAASLVYGECGGNADNVYCYTFAAPNTFYRTDSHYEKLTEIIPGENVTGKYAEPKGIKYRCIFNIVNDDDFVPKLPMEECEWTKYGRVATLSVINNYHLYENNLGIYLYYNSSDSMYYYTNPNLAHFLGNYKGNPDNPIVIAEGFANIFDDRSNMRKDVYKKSEVMHLLVDGGKDINKTFFRYSLPYQKNEYEKTLTIYENYVETTYNKVDTSYNGNGDVLKNAYKQIVSPQYLFSSVAEMMHEYSDYENDVDKKGYRKKVNNELKFFIMDLPPKYYNARKCFISLVPLNLRALNLKDPHYLESYYTLTKIINTMDFK